MTFRALLDDLPGGAFVALDDRPGTAFLLRDGALHPWSHAGYGAPIEVARTQSVSVLTPLPTIGALKAGYAPKLAAVPGG